MLEPVLISGLTVGGQLTITTDVENYPGYADVIQGPWLMEQMRAQAEHVGTRFVRDTIASVDLSRRPFRLVGDTGAIYTCDALIVATGAEAKWLNLPSEQKFRGYGVSACATCDGFFYKNREVVVVGGGNTAVEEALFLTKFASKVTLIHRRDALRAEKILQNRFFAHEKIDVIWDSEIVDVVGKEGFPPAVTGVEIRNLKSGARRALAADGVFVAIGHAPSVEFLGGQLRLKSSGYVWTEPGSTRTSVAGVFAAGDVTDETFRQAVTAAGLGCMAALEAERFLAHGHATAEAAE
jgi:thioredoxin reductase (NADPH)